MTISWLEVQNAEIEPCWRRFKRGTGRLSLLLALFFLAFLSGCGGSSQKETCGICRGSGKAVTGNACSFCDGRGYRTVSKSEIDRRQMAEENLRRRQSGEDPLSDGEWWWEKHGSKLGGFIIACIVLYFLNRPPKRASDSPPNTQ